MNNLKPTQREVKVLLNSMGLKLPRYMFNDKRVKGGRIKMCGYQMSLGDMSKMQELLRSMFPHLSNIKVERWVIPSTTIKWNNGEEQPTHHMAPFGGTYEEELPSQRHDW